MNRPLISVIMSVYNGADYLNEAVGSILAQTVEDFEFIIIDDCSTDSSAGILETYDDSRIKIVRNDRNIGLTRSLNIGLKLAEGRYIARMDADDIAFKERFAKQIEFLKRNPEVALCGTWAEIFGIYGSDKIFDYPSEDEYIRGEMPFINPFVHSTIMIDRDCIDEKVEYDESYVTAQDYELWARLGQKYKTGKVEEILLKYRFHKKQITLDRTGEQIEAADAVRKRELNRIGVSFDDKEFYIHRQISSEQYTDSLDFVEDAGKWLIRLIRENETSGCLKKDIFMEIVAGRWYRICNSATSLGFRVFRLYLSCEELYKKQSLVENMLLALKSLVYWKLIRKDLPEKIKKKLFERGGAGNG